MRDEVEEKTWDKKKIAIGVVVLLIAAAILYVDRTTILGKLAQLSKTDVRGAKTEKIDKPLRQYYIGSPKQALSEKIEAIKKEVNNLDVVEVASSSPQVQKVISDIKALEQYPQSQAKEACRKICETL